MKRLVYKTKRNLRETRRRRVRARVIGAEKKPRLSVFRSLRSITAQLIDDASGKTMCSASGREIKDKKVEGRAGKEAVSFLVGKLLAEKAKAKGVAEVVFDRAGYKYHGRVKALAEGAREGGLIF
ncbi:MAG: 50S ribosomal protein L18 [Patescibacteria group bacterium]|nr:50S ribosomal protein L18 [Patescibacteria group bacterium]